MSIAYKSPGRTGSSLYAGNCDSEAAVLQVLPACDVALNAPLPRAKSQTIMSCIALFVFLQVLDVLTTIIGIRVEAGELSPFIRWLMRAGPLAGLLAAKIIGCALGVVCVWTGRIRVISRVNCFFAGLVLWNLLIILQRIMK